jgi:RNA polymerase sigma factor (sigma-70 family)
MFQSEQLDHVAVEAPDLDGIFARYLDPVYRFLYSRVGNREDAEDLTSQVFLKASQHLDRRKSDASLASWFMTVAKTTVADHWRRYYRTPPLRPIDDGMMADRLYEVAASEPSYGSEQLVGAVLKDLSPRYRRVLQLRFLQGCSVDEAALEMGVTVGNLKVLQHRALARAAEIGLPAWQASEVNKTPALGSSSTLTPNDHVRKPLTRYPPVNERNMA